ncbi:MAG: serine/threonine protein kinase, bacterial [Acidimicrobiaceae bacterium]|jgi:serine/threonine-protein kinase
MSETAPAPTSAVSIELPFGATRQEGRFEIRRVLGRGGFGITYAAGDRRLHREVAIKELCFGAVTRIGGVLVPPPHEAEAFASAKERFLREGAMLARFSHPGVVRIYEVFEEAGTAYLVMELLDGRTLHQLVVARAGALPEPQVLEVAARCGEALSVLHGAGVLHRDLNPTNVVLTPEGRVVLIDFGLAREFAGDATTPLTRIVTPGYAAPEQYEHQGRCGPPTDVFGLAATLYCALTGRAPVALGGRRRGTAFVAPRALNPAVTKIVSDAVLDGLELDADHRPRTVDEFLSRLGVGSALVLPTQYAERVAAPPVPVPSGPSFISPPPPAPVSVVGHQGRAKVVGPAIATVAALGALVPVVMFALLALVVLPALATAGDAMIFVRMRRLGDRMHWRHRAALPGYLPMRFVRNVGRVCYAGVPALLVAGVTVALALLLNAVSSTFTAESWVLRVGGATAAVMVAVPVFRDRVRFRAAVVGDRVLAMSLDNGTLTSFGLTIWIVTALVAAIAVGLRPDPWPFGS